MPKPATAARNARAKRNAFVRMYRHGLGDCFLVRLPKADGKDTFNILIDCGLITVAGSAREKMEEVASDIAGTCGGHLDVVVMTHEHWDHASGFSTQQAQAIFDGMTIDEVWYAWTEDGKNALGRKLRREREAKVNALQAAAVALRESGTPLGLARADRIASILQFFGAGPLDGLASLAAAGSGSAMGKTRAAFEYLGKRSDVAVRYCRPADEPIELEGVEGVRVYVLGPPEDEGLLKRSSPTKKGKEVYEFAADLAMDDSLGAAFLRMADPSGVPGGPDCPFEASLCFPHDEKGPSQSERLDSLRDACWKDPGADWRRIQLDWTSTAETLALNLDSHTNNTCLVIAIELVDSGRVLLFPADAQVGNWLSWQDVGWEVADGERTRRVTGPELLQRTVFYKVGHHGSHNATLRALGLEQMTSTELMAFVPVFKAHAVKNRWMEMPFEPLVQRLREKTGGRVVFSDDEQDPPAAGDLGKLSAGQRSAFLRGLKVTDLYYEYAIGH